MTQGDRLPPQRGKIPKGPTDAAPISGMAGIETAINILSLLIASLVLYIAVDSVLRDREDRKIQTCRKLTSLVDLAADDISRSLGGARDSLRLLSRMPALRETRLAGRLNPILTSATSGVAHVAAFFEENMEMGMDAARQNIEKANTVLDLTGAGFRRGLFELGWKTDSAEPSQDLPWLKLPSTVFFQECFGWFRRIWGRYSPVWLSAGVWFDELFPSGESLPVDAGEIQRLLNTSLSDKDLIRAVAVKSFDGKRLVSATEIGGSDDFFSRWGTGNVIKSGRPYYPGPVWFHEGLGRPLWQIALPLRDRDRNPFAVLTSQIDLAFLGEIVSKSRISSASYLFIVDEEGTVISHPKSSIVTNQVNVARSNPAVMEAIAGNDGFREVAVGGSGFFAAYRQLKNLDSIGLPGWGILYMTPVSEVLQDPITAFLSFLFWTGLIFYAVYYVNNLILITLEDGWDA